MFVCVVCDRLSVVVLSLMTSSRDSISPITNRECTTHILPGYVDERFHRENDTIILVGGV
jgi:hypothetical protein